MSLPQKLTQLYPIHSFPAALRRDAILSGFVGVFLLAFKPFRLDVVYIHDQNYLILGYGLVTFLTLVINDCLGYKVLSRQFAELKWTVRSQILWLTWRLLTLGVTNFLYSVFTGASEPTLSEFLHAQAYVILCGVFPITFFILWWQNHLLKRNLAEALELEQNIVTPATAAPSVNPSALLRFDGENKDELLEVPEDSLYYVVSQDNYVEFVWEGKGGVKRSLLRSTLSKVEEIVANSPSFFRSHRAYLVNLSKVTAVAGNAQGYTLEIPNAGELIPVSRGRGKELNRLLQEGKGVKRDFNLA
jgi:LytTr DNA-binding domain